MKTVEEIRIDHNRALSGNYQKMEQCGEDIRFANMPGYQWRGSDNYNQQFQNKPKPEFNQVSDMVNATLGQKQRMEIAPVIVPNSTDATDDNAEMLMSRFRHDLQQGDGKEAQYVSDWEAYFGGFGCIKWVAKYEDEEEPNPDNQYLCAEPVPSAWSSVMFNAGAIKKDKSDAHQCWQIVRTNRLLLEEEFGVEITPFPQNVENRNYFDWSTGSNLDVYVAHYWEVITKKVRDFTFGEITITTGDGIKDQFGNKFTQEELKIMKERMPYTERRRTIKYVEYALIDGSQYLTKPTRTPFKRIPMIPQYGHHFVDNGIEYFCGEVRKQRDAQMYYNAIASCYMQHLSANQVDIPEYAVGAMVGHEEDRAIAALRGDPYLESNLIEINNVKQSGLLHVHGPSQLGTGLQGASGFAENNLSYLGGKGMERVPSNASGDAISQVHERMDDRYQGLLHNSMMAQASFARAWIDAAQAIYFTNSRSIRTIGKDGTMSMVETLQYGVNDQGMLGQYKNDGKGKYSVQVKMGESHKTQQDAVRRDSLEMLQVIDSTTPQGQILAIDAALAGSMSANSDTRKALRAQQIRLMLADGVEPTPQNDEEERIIAMQAQSMQESMMQQQQIQQAKDEMAFQTEMKAIADEGQGKLLEGQAAIMNEQNDRMKLEVDAMNAETARIDTLSKVDERQQKSLLAFLQKVESKYHPIMQ